MTSLRQIEANQRNAQHSTGPRTDEGKEQSRRNALKHGLAGAGVVLPEDEAEAVARRKAEWHSSLRPWNALEDWLAGQVVIASVQIDRCQGHEPILRTQQAERASEHWDADRRLAAEVLAAGLSRKPALISRQLQQTPQGCDWIIERWEGLGRALEQNGDWTGPQRALALDLLGTPPELRDGPTALDPTPGQDAHACHAAVVAREVSRWTHEKTTVLVEIDARERLAAEMGIEYDVPRPLSLLRRYEAACQRRLRWALDQIRHGQRSRPGADPTPVPTPAFTPAFTPAPAPARPVAPAPPFDARLVNDADDDDWADEEELLSIKNDPEFQAELARLTELGLLLPSDLRLSRSSAAPPAPAPSSSAPAASPRPSTVSASLPGDSRSQEMARLRRLQDARPSQDRRS